MPQKYRINTDTGSYIVTVGDDTEQAAPPQDPELARMGGSSPDELSRITPMEPKDRFSTVVGGAIRRNPAKTGAMIGGALAVPLTGGASAIPAIAAAGLGGAGGAGLGMLTSAALDPSSPAPNTAGGVLGTMAKEGAIQAGAEGGGRLIQAGLKAGAGRLYQSVLKPTLAARREYPDLVQTGLREGVPVSAHGAEQAGELMTASKGTADALVKDAASAPGATMIDPRDAVGGITPAVQQARKLPVSRPQLRAIGDTARQYLNEHQAPMALDQAQEAVRATDRFYNSAYRATMDRGNAVQSGNLAATMGINDETRNLLRDAVPGLQAQNKTTQGLHGLQEAISRRTGQVGNNSAIGMQHLINAGLAGGATAYGGKEKGLGTFLLLEALTNPASASRIAIASHGAASLPAANAIRAALIARLTGQSETP